MHIGELRPQIGDFAMRMAFLVSKKVLFLAWQGAAKPMLRCNVDENENDDLDSRWLYDAVNEAENENLQQSCG